MDASDSVGRLVLRLTVGVLLLFHGVHKMTAGIGGIEHMVVMHGVPGWAAYCVYLGEVLGPILIILGVFTRVGALLIVINMIVAVLLAGTGRLFVVGPTGGYALELEAFFLFGAVAIMLLGAGSLSLGGRLGRWN